jgi:streptomycin 6-kinase
MAKLTIFEPWLTRWALTPDGEPFRTPYGNWLMPVQQGREPAMLKIANSVHEIAGAAVMAWWAGDGAASVLAREESALLLERLPSGRSLADMARSGEDDEATRILCQVADKLHLPRAERPPATLFPLERWFRALPPAAETHGGIFDSSLAAMRALLAEPLEIAVLHGDLHHNNVLDGGARGWLAIDPKGLLGERGYEYATMLCNPDASIALAPGRLARQISVAAQAGRLEPARLTRWILAHAGVSAAWCMADGFDPKPVLALAEVAKALADGP